MGITSFYNLLEVSTNASRAEVDAKYAACQQKFLKTYGDDPVKLALVLSLLKDAYETLIDPVRRLAHDKALDAHMAEIVEKQSHAKDSNSKVTSCYYLLGVDRGKATRDQIENGYRASEEKLRRAFGGEPLKLEKALKVITYAYETLTDPLRKVEHDRILDAQVAEILKDNKGKSGGSETLQAAQQAAQAATQAAKAAANALEELATAKNKLDHDLVEKYKQEIARKRNRNIGLFLALLIIGAFLYTYSQKDRARTTPSQKSIGATKEAVPKKQAVTSQEKLAGTKKAHTESIKPTVAKEIKPDAATLKAAEIVRQNEEAKRLCDRVYGQDAMMQEQIKNTRELFDNQLERLKDQRLRATLGGAANHSNMGLMFESMSRAGQPYKDRMDQVTAERDAKVSQIQYEQKRLRYDHQQCYP